MALTRYTQKTNKMKRLIIILYALFSINTYAFTAQEIAHIEWGTKTDQVALSKAPANHFGPPSFVVNKAGIYLLDSANQRILALADYSSIPLSSDEADDFCMKDDKHFYLLFSRKKKVVVYNRAGQRVQTHPIKINIVPVAIQCHQGLILESVDGLFYRFNDDTPLTLIPFGQYTFQVKRHNDSQGTLWLHNRQKSHQISVKSKVGILNFIDFIGLDKAGNIYLTVEEVINEGLDSEEVLRFLRKYTQTGQLIAEEKLPYSLYAYTLKDLVVTPQGEVFQMLPLKKHLKLIKWKMSKFKTRSSQKPLLQTLFSYTEKQSEDFEPSEAPEENPVFSRYRSQKRVHPQKIIERAKEYVNYKFYVRRFNLTHGSYMNGKKVITPIKSAGYHTGVPYKWGGFDSLKVFQQGLDVGKKAGDICASKCSGKYFGSSGVVGIDCSGLISQVWDLNHKYSTRTLPQISIPLKSKNDLQAGDILNQAGSHVRLFSHRDKRGRFYVYEAAGGRTGKVVMRSYTSKELKKYKPYRYKWLIPTLQTTQALDIKYVYRPRWSRAQFKPLKEGTILYSGDSYKIIFTPSETSYVYIFQKDSTGQIYRLFPMKSFGGVTVNNFNPAQAAVTYYIPGQEKSFTLDKQRGEEKIYVIATQKQNKQLEKRQTQATLESFCEDCMSELTFQHF